MPGNTVNSRFGRGLRLAVSLALLIFLFVRLDLRSCLQMVSEAYPWRIGVVFLMTIADRMLAAYRWFLLVRGKSTAATFPVVVRVFFISNFLGTFLPGSIGVEAIRVYGLSRATSDVALSVSSILVERVFALLALLALVLMGLAASPPGLPASIAPWAWGVLFFLVAGSATLMHPRLRSTTHFLLPGAWLAPVRKGLNKLYASLDGFKTQPRLLLAVMVLSVIFQMLRVATALACAWALGLEVSITHFIVIVPVVILVTMLPISIGGLGVREVSYVYLLGLAGIRPEAALTLSLLLYFIYTAAVLPGAWFYARGRGA